MQVVFSGYLLQEAMVPIEFWFLQNSNHLRLVMVHSMIIIHLNWTILLLYNPLILVWIVSIGLHHSHWLVWLSEWIELTDLPQLQSVKLSSYTFIDVHSVEFESDWMNWLMIQICQKSNPFNSVSRLFMVIMVLIGRWLANHPTTTRTHWQWEVRLNEMMNE